MPSLIRLGRWSFVIALVLPFHLGITGHPVSLSTTTSCGSLRISFVRPCRILCENFQRCNSASLTSNNCAESLGSIGKIKSRAVRSVTNPKMGLKAVRPTAMGLIFHVVKEFFSTAHSSVTFVTDLEKRLAASPILNSQSHIISHQQNNSSSRFKLNLRREPLVQTLEQLKYLVDECKVPFALVYKHILGDTTLDSIPEHPVIEVLRRRAAAHSRPGRRDDGHKIALAIEGGGMRGAVSAGMVAAIHHLGLQDSFDVIYGSSAGALIGAYFVSGAGAAETHRLFIELLANSGKNFIDPSRFLDVLHTHPSHPPQSLPSKPIMSIETLYQMMREDDGAARFEWDAFQLRDKVQPLKIVASSLRSRGSVVLGSQEGSYTDFQGLLDCLKASCYLPGIAGFDPVPLGGGGSVPNTVPDMMVDALVYEPIPYRAALDGGCTHVLVLRTWPDGVGLPTSPLRVFEKILAPLCLQGFPEVISFLNDDMHARIYAEDILQLNHAAKHPNRATAGGHVLPIAIHPSEPLLQMELREEVLMRGIIQGFARAYDILLPAAAAASAAASVGNGRSGLDVAAEVFSELRQSAAVRRSYTPTAPTLTQSRPGSVSLAGPGGDRDSDAAAGGRSREAAELEPETAARRGRPRAVAAASALSERAVSLGTAAARAAAIRLGR